MEQFKKLLLGGNWLRDVALALTIIILAFYALVGSLYLHGTKHTVSNASTCDMIQVIDKQLYCLARMHYEDDNIIIIRSER